MKMQLFALLSILIVFNIQSYERYKTKSGEKYVRQSEDPKKKVQEPTYYTDDGAYAVFLTLRELRIIERILKPHTWSDQDYNATIDDRYIKRYSGGCCDECGRMACPDVSQCASCSADARLFIEVMNDFRGKTVRILFNQLNLRNEL